MGTACPAVVPDDRAGTVHICRNGIGRAWRIEIDQSTITEAQEAVHHVLNIIRAHDSAGRVDANGIVASALGASEYADAAITNSNKSMASKETRASNFP